MMKSIEAKTDPYGAPDNKSCSSDITPFAPTLYYLLFNNFFNPYAYFTFYFMT